MRYRLLGRTGLRVSEICLGTMGFGQPAWGQDAASAPALFDAFAEAGGTFIDTADMYAKGESERILADLIARDRDHFVLATKFAQVVDRPSVTAAGNGRKAMVRAVEASLARLKTDHIDLLYLHLWDNTTPLDEVMRAFDDLVRAGKILYPGISNVPAWIVARGQTIAEERDLSPFAAIQIQYSLAARTPERDLKPMADSLGIAVTAWGALGAGVLTGKYRPGVDATHSRGMPLRDEQVKIGARIAEAAEQAGVSPAQLALAWLLRRDVIPVIGARTADQLRDNLAAVDVTLDPAIDAAISEATKPELGYPHELLASPFMDERIFAGQRAGLQRGGVVS